MRWPVVRPVRSMVAVMAACLVMAGTTVGCATSDDASSGSDTTAVTRSSLSGLVRESPLEVGDMSLPDVTGDQDNGPFVFAAAPGELLVVYFGYTTCPDVCPTTLAFLRTAREELGDDAAKVDLAMVTIDPDRDTAVKLTAYLGSFADRYHAIRTTDRDELKTVEDAFGAQSEVTVAADGTVDVSHTGTTYVVDSSGTVLVEWPFGVTADEMADDLKILIGEQKSGT